MRSILKVIVGILMWGESIAYKRILKMIEKYLQGIYAYGNLILGL